MSGIYIPGMEMPEACIWCPMFNGEWGVCQATQKNVLNVGKKKDCPLVPVPPHGRLIDADALEEKQTEDADLFQNAYTLMEKTRRDEALNAIANIVNAPTIIPAEPADKEGEG